MTREELITLLVRYANYLPEVIVETGSGDWSGRFVDIAISNGYVSGYPDGQLHLDWMVNRAQAVRILNMIWDRVFDESSVQEQMLNFTDVPQDHWAYAEIVEAAVTHEYRREGTKEVFVR